MVKNIFSFLLKAIFYKKEVELQYFMFAKKGVKVIYIADDIETLERYKKECTNHDNVFLKINK